MKNYWYELVDSLNLSGKAKELARNSSLFIYANCSDEEIFVLRVNGEKYGQEKYADPLEKALRKKIGSHVKLKIVINVGMLQ